MSEEQSKSTNMDRREFVAASVTAGLAAGAVSAPAQQRQVVERDVQIKTPDGTCDAAFVHPATGSYAGVLIWADAFGLRPALREMAKRLAAEGYSVLVPNPFYRVQKAPVFTDVANFNFQNQTDRAKLTPLMGSVNAAGAAERDAAAYIVWMDQQREVDKSKKIGTQGYCMGGPLIMKTAATVPDRVGAAASFHGGGLTAMNPDGTPNPASPHLLIPKMKARLYVGIAANDDMQQPQSKDILRKAFADAKVQAEVEVYPNAQHGWCMPDMPSQGGAPIYNRADAEKAWTKLLALYKAALA